MSTSASHTAAVRCPPPSSLILHPSRLQIKDIGAGNFGVAKLMKRKADGSLVAVKLIERGEKVSKRKVAHAFFGVLACFAF